jgi:ABC-type bacteriocin/lantibiotic exporter with double-glycine peptidase domain
MGQVVDKEMEPQQGETPFEGTNGLTIELQDVTYVVPGRGKKILEDITFTITPQCSILLKGTSGSGRSTLLRLIAGIHEPSEGKIYVNNVALQGIYLNEYRSLLGQSLTEEYPFEGTILENVTFGDKNIPMEDVYWALEKTGLTQFVKEQPHGLQTMLYPEGKKIPYTISKKIVLARSVVHRPKLLILKDPLDQFEEKEAEEVMDFLSDSSNGWALVVVSENHKWVDRCNRILTIEKGKLINPS